MNCINEILGFKLFTGLNLWFRLKSQIMKGLNPYLWPLRRYFKKFQVTDKNYDAIVK